MKGYLKNIDRDKTKVVLAQMIQVTQLNPLGRVHGGEMVKIMDNAAAYCAVRYSGKVCVTVAMDDVDFHDAIYAGEIAVCEASLCGAGTTSMRVRVVLYGENIITGERRKVTSAIFTMVALDHHGRPAMIKKAPKPIKALKR